MTTSTGPLGAIACLLLGHPSGRLLAIVGLDGRSVRCCARCGARLD